MHQQSAPSRPKEIRNSFIVEDMTQKKLESFRERIITTVANLYRVVRSKIKIIIGTESARRRLMKRKKLRLTIVVNAPNCSKTSTVKAYHVDRAVMFRNIGK